MPEKMERNFILAYLGGILDGEGCIGIYKRNNRNGRSIRHQLTVQCNMQRKEAIQLLADNFGGLRGYRVKNKKTNAFIYEWRVQDKKAYECLTCLLPFLRVKIEEAILAIKFYETQFNKKRPGKFGGERKLEESELLERESYRTKLSAMKKEQYQYA